VRHERRRRGDIAATLTVSVQDRYGPATRANEDQTMRYIAAITGVFATLVLVLPH
jgi:hypothetical protein